MEWSPQSQQSASRHNGTVRIGVQAVRESIVRERYEVKEWDKGIR
jgi:hypothetical protein